MVLPIAGASEARLADAVGAPVPLVVLLTFALDAVPVSSDSVCEESCLELGNNNEAGFGTVRPLIGGVGVVADLDSDLGSFPWPGVPLRCLDALTTALGGFLLCHAAD